MKFTLAELATSAAGKAEGDAVLSGVAVDSRKVKPGDLFVAIRGERVDGHDFAADAASRGARALLGERRPSNLPPGFPTVLVARPVEALQKLAATIKKRTGFRLAAITGSAGKTTTKDFTAEILGRRFKVEKTPGNQNSQIGFAMSVCNLATEPEWMVGEMGLSEPGDLSKLSRAFEPDLAAILLVAAGHLQYFASVDAIADAKAEILEGLKPGGTFVANEDDPRVAAIARRQAGRLKVVRFGLSSGADVTARDVANDADASRFVLRTPAGEASVRLPLPGAHQVSNFLAASAIAFALGLSPADSAAAAANLRPAPHRGVWREHPSGARLYDDAYNANPASMQAALATLAAQAPRRRIAVLGEMLELGPEEERWHREAGAVAAKSADLLVCVGPRGRFIGEGAVAAGLPPGAARYAANAEEAAALLAPLLSGKDAVLFKASRAVGLERAVAALTGEA